MMKNPEKTSVPAATVTAITSMTQAEAVTTLKSVLRHAIKLEMATIPIYLYTYYSICRKPGKDKPPTGSAVSTSEAFPATSSLFGNQAGAVIMSVAVEEMLHMSLAMNLLTSMLDSDEDLPQIYDGLTFGNGGGIVLPALSTLTAQTGETSTSAPIEAVTGKPLEIPLGKLSLDQLQHFMRIEYPGKKGSKAAVGDPGVPAWATIGEVYDYAKALIQHGGGIVGADVCIPDSAFQKQRTVPATQIETDNYSASNIDTLSSGSQSFIFTKPPVVGSNSPHPIAASTVAKFENDDNHAHEGSDALFSITSADLAIAAINTICEQGEGSDFTRYVEGSDLEESHYYKFWSLCANLDGYPAKMTSPPQVTGITAPTAATTQITDLDQRFVYNFPTNPKSTNYYEPASALVDVANGLFQYMLIMTETTLLVPSAQQKLYFNKTMHQSMIWVMDKFYQGLRNVQDRGCLVVPTFENPFPAGTTRQTAFTALQKLVTDCQAKSSVLEAYSSVGWIISDIALLPDVSPFWDGNKGQTPSTLPNYLLTPTVPTASPDPSSAGTAGQVTSVPSSPTSIYSGTQTFPKKPPTNAALNTAATTGNWVRHACMGINSCKNQGRTLNNDCAGQGWCSTALAYNAATPSEPSINDHQCHVTNNCKGQGGCGLYGTEEELNQPGGNSCQARGSCATPINAERFITEGNRRKESVWQRARSHFQTAVWPTLAAANPSTSTSTLPAPGTNYTTNPALFADGPTIEWIEASGQGMTACGSSGMSGAGSCS